MVGLLHAIAGFYDSPQSKESDRTDCQVKEIKHRLLL